MASRSITKLKMSPPRPQPKHFHDSRAGVTVNDGVFSLWKGHRPLYEAPALRSWTVSPMSSTRPSFCFTSAAAPTDVMNLRPIGPRPPRCGGHDYLCLPPDTRMALSSLDKAQEPNFTP